MDGVIWKSVVGYEGIYEVSNHGSVRRIKSWRGGFPKLQISSCISNSGYVRFELNTGGKGRKFSAHRLVSEAFIGLIPDGYCVNHKDGNRLNNHVENLEIVTHADNSRHSVHVLGKAPPKFEKTFRGESSKRSKLSNAAVHEIRNTPNFRGRIKVFAEKFGVSVRTINYVISREGWAHLP